MAGPSRSQGSCWLPTCVWGGHSPAGASNASSAPVVVVEDMLPPTLLKALLAELNAAVAAGDDAPLARDGAQPDDERWLAIDADPSDVFEEASPSGGSRAGARSKSPPTRDTTFAPTVPFLGQPGPICRQQELPRLHIAALWAVLRRTDAVHSWAGAMVQAVRAIARVDLEHVLPPVVAKRVGGIGWRVLINPPNDARCVALVYS